MELDLLYPVTAQQLNVRLSALTEFYLKSLSQSLPSFVKDSTDFINELEDMNAKGPFPEGSLLVSWDVVSMFPNIDNNLGISAVRKALNSRHVNIPSTACLAEAVEICLRVNNCQFAGQGFVQKHVHGTEKRLQLCRSSNGHHRRESQI